MWEVRLKLHQLPVILYLAILNILRLFMNARKSVFNTPMVKFLMSHSLFHLNISLILILILIVLL